MSGHLCLGNMLRFGHYIVRQMHSIAIGFIFAPSYASLFQGSHDTECVLLGNSESMEETGDLLQRVK